MKVSQLRTLSFSAVLFFGFGFLKYVPHILTHQRFVLEKALSLLEKTSSVCFHTLNRREKIFPPLFSKSLSSREKNSSAFHSCPKNSPLHPNIFFVVFVTTLLLENTPQKLSNPLPKVLGTNPPNKHWDLSLMQNRGSPRGKLTCLA